jgi:hypothetical protein
MVNLNWQPGMTLESIEKEAILQAFRFYRANKTQTSIALGCAVNTLTAKLDSYKEGEEYERERHEERVRRDEEYQLRARDIRPDSSANREFSNPNPSANGLGADERLHVQSAPKHSPKQSVPLPVGKKVQEVPQASISNGSPRKNR